MSPGRTFKLHSAITALAVLMQTGLGAIPAAANDLSGLPCTAGDVEVVGPGTVVNEPCSCTAGGTFSAEVEFRIRNNTSSGRYCVTLHLVPDGTVYTQGFDVVLRGTNGSSTAPGKSGGESYHETLMRGTIPNFRCNVGRVCFGQSGVVSGKCDPGACSTISWSTTGNNAGCTTGDQSPPGGQCRHQQVCVVGFGSTVQCTNNCNVVCGQTSTLKACAVGPADRAPYSLSLSGSDGSSYGPQSTFVDQSGNACVDFTVSPTLAPRTTYTLTVTDKNGCTRTDTTSVGVAPTTVTLTADSNPSCNGIVQYTASVNGQNNCGFTWTIDGLPLITFMKFGGSMDDARVAHLSGTGNNTLGFRDLDNKCHTITASASCQTGNQSPCTASASTTVKQCVSSTQGCSIN